MVLLMRHRRWLLVLVPLCAAWFSSCADQAWEVRTYPLGQKVTIGHLTYAAIETQWYPALGDGPAARAAQNQFLLVRLSVANGGSTETAAPNLSVEDSTGHSFPELSDGEGVTDWIGTLHMLEPAGTLSGNAVFDVPAGHYTLRILDEDSQHEARIDLPLDFQSSPAEVLGLDPLKPAPPSLGKK
jgi:hypothetical protein